MSVISDEYQQAQLAEASYADFETGLNIKDSLQDGGFSSSQATDFAKHWKVADHQPDTLINGVSVNN